MANPPADFIARPDDMTTRRDAGRFETGNLNLPDIQALNAAIDLISKAGVENIERHVQSLGDRLIEHLDQQGIALVGPRPRKNRAHIYVLGLPAAEWTEHFTRNDVRVSPERDGIRVSFAMFNTVEDVDRLAEVIRRRGAEQAPSRAVERMD